ncbi:MAG: S-layer homology domain-containing protein [Oscillospiraceae bacterium]|nr:S-layer homology domain-containing protein [Oscillospiraceae bacterium]
MKRKLAGLLAALMALSMAATGAWAAEFKDLPPSHWAYKEIARAVSYGIMNGLGDGRMNPDGTLTWAHYLAMISRTFAPLAYAGARSSGVDWKNAGYQTALSKGYLRSNDFLTVTPETLNDAISRQDVAVLLSRILPDAPSNSSGGNSGAYVPNGGGSGSNSGASDNNSGAYGGGSYVPNGGGSGNGGENHMQVVTDSDGQMWLVVDGVSIPVTPRQAVYDPEYAPPVIRPAPSDASNPPLSDFNQMDANHQAALRRLYALEIVRGKSDGSFGPYDDVRRCDGAVLLMRTLDAIDELRAGETVSLTLELTDGDGKSVGETLTANGRIGQRLSELAALYAPTGYKVAPQDGQVSVITSRYALKFAPLTQAEKEEIEATAQYRQGQISYEEYMSKDFWLKKLGDNPRKRLLIFGAEYEETIEVTEYPEGAESVESGGSMEPVTHTETVTRTEIRYDSPEESQSHMAAVEVPVWKLRGNNKVSGTLNLTVNAALAEEVKAIFTEIYNDPEQFPISDGGGYSWRTNSRSEHIQGTAIDLNVDSNFQVRDGVALVGSGWTPGEDPYSITPGGSVVRVFAEHGWDWGGNAWAGHSDPTYGYHDYMHFSYFGR